MDLNKAKNSLPIVLSHPTRRKESSLNKHSQQEFLRHHPWFLWKNKPQPPYLKVSKAHFSEMLGPDPVFKLRLREPWLLYHPLKTSIFSYVNPHILMKIIVLPINHQAIWFLLKDFPNHSSASAMTVFHKAKKKTNLGTISQVWKPLKPRELNVHTPLRSTGDWDCLTHRLQNKTHQPDPQIPEDKWVNRGEPSLLARNRFQCDFSSSQSLISKSSFKTVSGPGMYILKGSIPWYVCFL